jgi:hypothetical protein
MMLIALTTLAFCGVAVASSGPLFNYVGTRTAKFAPQKQGHGGPGNVSTEFTGADTGINSSGFVYVTFKDKVGKSSAGLLEYYTFTASGAANWVCSMGGGGKGKHQAAGAPVTTNETSYTTFPSFTVGNNGTVSGGTAIPPAPEPPTACSGTWELGAVSYTLSPGSLTNTTGNYNADDVMTGSCTIGTKCSKVYISGVQAP